MNFEQKAHDLTVALVCATAQENTAKEFVTLYNSLLPEIEKALGEKFTNKAEVIDRRNLGI